MDRLKTRRLPKDIEIPTPTIEKVVKIAKTKKIICSFLTAIPPKHSVQGFAKKLNYFV